MTAMPQMVALLNGFGGGASVLVAGAALHATADDRRHGRRARRHGRLRPDRRGHLLGAASSRSTSCRSCSCQASRSSFPAQQARQRRSSVLRRARLICVDGRRPPDQRVRATGCWWSRLDRLGVLLTIPIGGADMPVVISLLNSLLRPRGRRDRLRASTTTCSSSPARWSARRGIILSQIMCKAMNRSLANVLFGGIGAEHRRPQRPTMCTPARSRAPSPDEVAMLLDGVAARGHRPRLRPGRRAGAARRARPGRTCSSRAAPRSSTPSIPSPAACRAT